LSYSYVNESRGQVTGGGTVSYSYVGHDVLQTVGPAPSGESTKSKQLEYDGLGRLKSVCEVTSGTGSGACGQANPKSGFLTNYAYDALGHLTSVTQSAQGGTAQSRSYFYDGLGRITSETNPENGTTTYTYDSDSTCGTTTNDIGSLVKRVDAVGNVACYKHDPLHRTTSITYPSGSYAANTDSKYFVYDAATVNDTTMLFTKGRLAEAYTCPHSGSCSPFKTDMGFSYTARGEPSDVYESTPDSGRYYHTTATYWANGALQNLLNNISGLPNVGYGVESEGRLWQVTASDNH
jgi:YD repeat-containing protein